MRIEQKETKGTKRLSVVLWESQRAMRWLFCVLGCLMATSQAADVRLDDLTENFIVAGSRWSVVNQQVRDRAMSPTGVTQPSELTTHLLTATVVSKSCWCRISETIPS
jgi:hypothetical protein